MREKGGERKNEREKRKREGNGFRGIEERGYWGGQDLILISLDRHECFSVFHHLQKDKQLKQRHPLKLGKKGRESSKRNYYIISPRVIIKAIIIIIYTFPESCERPNYPRVHVLFFPPLFFFLFSLPVRTCVVVYDCPSRSLLHTCGCVGVSCSV